MKFFGILSTVGLANADFISVFQAHDSVSTIAESLFQEITEHFPFENINGKILTCLYNINDLSLPSKHFLTIIQINRKSGYLKDNLMEKS